MKLEEVLRDKEQAIYQRCDAEKQELYEEIRELKEACSDSEKVKRRLTERHFFNKWLYFSFLHKVKGAPEETQRQLAERTERTLIEREMQLMDVRRYQNFKDDNFNLMNQIAELKFKYTVKNNMFD